VALKRCTDCGGPLSSKAQACPTCGRQTLKGKLDATSNAYAGFGAIVIFVLLIIGVEALLN
jgi:hypothetical protein